MKTIHILMSTYNGEMYLQEQLDSLLTQTRVQLSIYIRDDGSTDKTRSLLADYQAKYPNIHLLFENNVGYVASFWKLVQQAHGADYYAFCDQDDLWQADKCISAIQALENKKQAGPLLYTSNVTAIDAHQNILAEKGFEVDTVLSYPLCLARGSLPGCTFVFNAGLLNQLKKYHGPQISHDWTTYLICRAIGTVVYDPISHIHYRIHGDNTIGTNNSTLSKKIHRFLHGEYKGVRSSIARHILSIYGSQMTPEKIEVTQAFARQDIKKLMKYPDYQNLNFMIQCIARQI